MPIEFICPSCAKLLRTPDESAGKKAKCPQCGTIAEVPAASTALPASPFGDSNWSAPSPFGDASGMPPKPSPSPFADAGGVNPYASPVAAAGGVSGGVSVEEIPRTGLPWDRERKSVKTFWETSKLILGSPVLAFSIMLREGGIGGPLGFAVIGGALGGLMAGTFNTLFQLGLIAIVSGAAGQMPPPAIGAGVQVAIQLPAALAYGTLGTLILTFLFAGLNHLLLMLFGGARFPFETTYRVVAYVMGATALVQVIPMCGGQIALLLSLIYAILGLTNAHRIGVGKAVAAALLSLLALFLICAIPIAAAFGLAIFAIGR